MSLDAGTFPPFGVRPQSIRDPVLNHPVFGGLVSGATGPWVPVWSGVLTAELGWSRSPPPVRAARVVKSCTLPFPTPR